MPYFLPNVLFDFVSSKYTAVFTNLQGSKENLKMLDKDLYGGFYIGSAGSMLQLTICFAVYGDYTGLSIMADKSTMYDSQVLLNHFMKAYHSQLYRADHWLKEQEKKKD